MEVAVKEVWKFCIAATEEPKGPRHRGKPGNSLRGGFCTQVDSGLASIISACISFSSSRNITVRRSGPSHSRIGRWTITNVLLGLKATRRNNVQSTITPEKHGKNNRNIIWQARRSKREDSIIGKCVQYSIQMNTLMLKLRQERKIEKCRTLKNECNLAIHK